MRKAKAQISRFISSAPTKHHCLNKAPLVGAFLLLVRKKKSFIFNGLQGERQNFT